MRPIISTLEVPDCLRGPEYDLVSIVREIEDANRIAVVSHVTDRELEFLIQEANQLATWNGEERRQVCNERRQAVKTLMLEEAE